MDKSNEEKIPEKNDNIDLASGEETDVDSDESSFKDNRSRLKYYKKELNKLWESTMKMNERANDIGEQWKKEHERLLAANKKLMNMTKNFNCKSNWFNSDKEEKKSDPMELVSKIPKPKPTLESSLKNIELTQNVTQSKVLENATTDKKNIQFFTKAKSIKTNSAKK